MTGAQGLEVLSQHASGEGHLRDIHDTLNRHSRGSDDLGLEGDVELGDVRVAGDGGVSGALKGFNGVVGQFTSGRVVARDGFRGGDVVGDRADLFVFRIGARCHHIRHVGDGVAVEIS